MYSTQCKKIQSIRRKIYEAKNMSKHSDVVTSDTDTAIRNLADAIKDITYLLQSALESMSSNAHK